MLKTAVGWGANSVDESYRPSRGYLTAFPSTPTTTVSNGGSITDAIYGCDGKVGSGNYCLIEVQGTPVQETVYIARSRTKLLGNSATMTGSGQSYRFIQVDSGTSEVVIEGMEIVGHQGNDVTGIAVDGTNIEKVAMINNHIHDFDGDAGGAHAIVVLGGPGAGVKEVIIQGNLVENMKTGYSESIAMNGNIEGFEIIRNDVVFVNNIAIDAIGGEGVGGTTTENGRVLPHPDDSARFGFIENNFVGDMSTRNNPAYPDPEEAWSAAFYVDGASNIKVAYNEVEDSSWGFEIGSENCKIVQDITMMGNKASGSYFGDAVFGGYASTGYLADTSIGCDPTSTVDNDEGHGYVQRITVTGNNFTTTNPTVEKVFLQKRITYAIIAAPGVDPVNANGDGSASGDQNAIRTS